MSRTTTHQGVDHAVDAGASVNRSGGGVASWSGRIPGPAAEFEETEETMSRHLGSEDRRAPVTTPAPAGRDAAARKVPKDHQSRPTETNPADLRPVALGAQGAVETKEGSVTAHGPYTDEPTLIARGKDVVAAITRDAEGRYWIHHFDGSKSEPTESRGEQVRRLLAEAHRS